MNNKSGQVLVILIFFMAMALTVTGAAIILNYVGSLSTAHVEEGVLSNQVAESGMENALLRLLRNPNYTGEVLTIDNGTVTVNIAGTLVKTITAVATSSSNFTRTIEVHAQVANGTLQILSWKELF